MEKDIINDILSLNPIKLKECLLLEGEKQEELFELARYVRDLGPLGKKVELRSVIEVSNKCRQACRYCGIGKNSNNLYTLTKNEILERIKLLADMGRRTFLIQSGEYVEQNFIDDICYCCSEALQLYPDIRIILCLGNLSKEQYKQLKSSGASRYILKFETGRADHHKFCRPKDTLQKRLECVQTLVDVGFKVGTGNIIGLPGQTIDDLVNDLILTTKFKLSMVSSTKFIPNESSEFKNEKSGDINLTLNFIALLRILHPDCLIPTTSSLQKENQNGQLLGLMAGCNTVTVHDGTPAKFRKSYPIYSDNRFTPAEQYCREIISAAGMTAENYLI